METMALAASFGIFFFFVWYYLFAIFYFFFLWCFFFLIYGRLSSTFFSFKAPFFRENWGGTINTQGICVVRLPLLLLLLLLLVCSVIAIVTRSRLHVHCRDFGFYGDLPILRIYAQDAMP